MPAPEIEREIREIKREIIESRGLVIKTNNLTSTLGSDLKSIAKRQAAYERKLFVNSAVAYVFTFGVVFVFVYVLNHFQTLRFDTEIQALEQQNQQLEAELEEREQAKAARVSSMQHASKLSQMISSGDREKVLKAVSETNREELTALENQYLNETVERFRSELSMRAFQEGQEHLRQSRYREAVGAFERSVGLAKNGSQVPRVRLQMAQALRQEGRQGSAVTVLQDVLDSDLIDRDLVGEARWNLALCYIEMRKRHEARRELLYLITKFPRSHWARQARPKMQDVLRMD